MISVCPISNWVPDSLLQVTVSVVPELSFDCGSLQTATAVERFGALTVVWFEGQKRNIGSSTSAINIYRSKTKHIVNENK